MALQPYSQQEDHRTMSTIPKSCNVTELAELCALKPRRLQQLAAAGVIPRASRNSYQVAGAVQGLIDYWRAQAERRSDIENPLDYARRRKLEAEGELKHLELARIRGDSVPMEHVVGLLEEALKPINWTLLAAPKKYASSLAKKAGIGDVVARRILETVIEEVRAELRYCGAEDGEPEGA